MVREIHGIERLLTLLPDIPAIHPAWKQLVSDHGVRGVKVYDARLVALMTVYAVDQVLTFNAADFARYDNITALSPTAVLA